MAPRTKQQKRWGGVTCGVCGAELKGLIPHVIGPPNKPPPPATGRQLSKKGDYFWDGAAWQPVAPDGRAVWNGSTWLMISEDRHWLWDGTSWQQLESFADAA